ncbi:MAG: sulfatase-like hydrolase/transferase [Chloroflexi bacterium]|nr:sulfatase-like hydrolase/transferase [Chloroflexota bacterium]
MTVTKNRAGLLPDERSERPNILWIGVDQMRSDTPGCYGNSVCSTPHIDRLATEGVRFSNAYAPCGVCTPARASMFTGLHAFKHGMGTNCDMYHALASELPDPGSLLHHRLTPLGYRCAFAGKWHIGTRLGPAEHGFEGLSLPGYGDLKREPEYQRYLQESGLAYGPVLNPVHGNAGQKTLLAGQWNGPLESTPTYYLADYAIGLLEQLAASGEPFFLICQFWGPHPPYLPSAEFAGWHDRGAIEPWINFRDDYRGKPQSVIRTRSDFYRLLPSEWSGWRELVGLYYDFTTLVDAQLGRILAHLDQLGLAEDTLVIFTSDHGDMIGSHGGLFDKGFMYEEAHRVPLIVRWPARFRGSHTCDALVYNMDIFPTILDILRQPDESLDGQSLLPLLDGRSDSHGREAIYLEFHGMRYLYSQRALVTRDGHKYIFNAGDLDEVYDLNQDPGELHNLIAEKAYRESIESLRWQLMQTAVRIGDPIRDYIFKIFGRWEDLSGQPDVSAPISGMRLRSTVQ